MLSSCKEGEFYCDSSVSLLITPLFSHALAYFPCDPFVKGFRNIVPLIVSELVKLGNVHVHVQKE